MQKRFVELSTVYDGHGRFMLNTKLKNVRGVTHITGTIRAKDLPKCLSQAATTIRSINWWVIDETKDIDLLSKWIQGVSPVEFPCLESLVLHMRIEHHDSLLGNLCRLLSCSGKLATMVKLVNLRVLELHINSSTAFTPLLNCLLDLLDPKVLPSLKHLSLHGDTSSKEIVYQAPIIRQLETLSMSSPIALSLIDGALQEYAPNTVIGLYQPVGIPQLLDFPSGSRKVSLESPLRVMLPLTVSESLAVSDRTLNGYWKLNNGVIFKFGTGAIPLSEIPATFHGARWIKLEGFEPFEEELHIEWLRRLRFPEFQKGEGVCPGHGFARNACHECGRLRPQVPTIYVELRSEVPPEKLAKVFGSHPDFGNERTSVEVKLILRDSLSLSRHATLARESAKKVLLGLKREVDNVAADDMTADDEGMPPVDENMPTNSIEDISLYEPVDKISRIKDGVIRCTTMAFSVNAPKCQVIFS